MKALTANWADPFRSLIHQVPDETEVVSIRVADWIFSPRRQRGHPRVVLVGDSAHTMTMCLFFLFFLVSVKCDVLLGAGLCTNRRDVVRGEGANNAIVDVQDLVKRIDFTSTEYDMTPSLISFHGFYGYANKEV